MSEKGSAYSGFYILWCQYFCQAFLCFYKFTLHFIVGFYNRTRDTVPSVCSKLEKVNSSKQVCRDYKPVPSFRAFCSASNSINLSSISYNNHQYFHKKVWYGYGKGVQLSRITLEWTSVFETAKRSCPSSNCSCEKNSWFNLQIPQPLFKGKIWGQ
jgi:hypothetical protein